MMLKQQIKKPQLIKTQKHLVLFHLWSLSALKAIYEELKSLIFPGLMNFLRD